MNNIVLNIKNKIKDDKVIVACSTGVDSCVLLNLCLGALNKEQIIVAHVNHGVRIESKDEEEYINKQVDISYKDCLIAKEEERVVCNLKKFNELEKTIQKRFCFKKKHKKNSFSNLLSPSIGVSGAPIKSDESDWSDNAQHQGDHLQASLGHAMRVTSFNPESASTL